MKPHSDQSPSVLRRAAGPAALLVLAAAAVFHAEGPAGFKPFLNLEALVIVVLPTFALLWAAAPLKDIMPPRTPEIARYGADLSMAMGVFGTLLGVVMLLASDSDAAQIPRRLALALAALMYGLFLSKAVFSPIAFRLESTRSDRRRLNEP